MYTQSWSSSVDTTPEVIDTIQAGLTVRLVMTDRRELKTCRPQDSVDSIAADNVDQFSFLPVEQDGRICGLYNAERWFETTPPQDQTVGQDFEHLNEDHLVGSDASILQFMTTADEHSTRLVVSGGEVTGLVCLADINKLPVRAALFSAVTGLEITMAKRINEAWPNDSSGWLSQFSDKRRTEIEQRIADARRNDTFVSPIVETQFADKAKIIRKMDRLPSSGKGIKKAFHEIQKLRDYLAHGNDYARTKTAAQRVCQTVRSLIRIANELHMEAHSLESS